MATYQTQAIADVHTVPLWQAASQWIGAGFTTMGWTAVGMTGSATPLGAVVASGTGAAYAWTNTGSVLTAPTTVMAPQTAYRFNGAWVSGATYAGTNTAGSTTVDLVTFATAGNTPVTYQKITAASAGTTNPPNDATNWQPLIFEIWKSNGAQSTTNPIYVRIQYSTGSVTAGDFNPRYNIAVGSGIDSNGNLTGTVALTATTPTGMTVISQAAVAIVNVAFDCNVSGDADNIRMVGFRGSTQTAPSNTFVFVIDRSKTSSGADSDAFAYVGLSGSHNGTAVTSSGILLKPALGTPVIQTTTGWAGTIANGSLSSSLIIFGTTPPLLIFPLVGYVANPLLGAVGFNNNDVVDGQIYPVWIYGATHNYMSINSQTVAASTLTNFANGVTPAIRWE